MLHLGGGEAIANIVKAFEDLGYRWAYRLVNSQNFGVPQRRERVYFLASKTINPADVLFREPMSSLPPIRKPVDTSRHIGFYWTEGTYATGLADDALPPLKGGSSLGIPSAPAIMSPCGLVGTPDIRDAERIQGFSENWTFAAENVGKPSLRWKLVGNAVTVNVSKWIADGFSSPSEFDQRCLRPHHNAKWPNSAFGYNGQVWEVVGDFGPSNRVSLSEYLNYPLKPLSYRAVNGFINRALKGNLRYPEGFIDALIRYSKSL
jgi:DNA (cytosine-5)-methyltransferase 1